jgi:WD40 repeat protein
MKSILVLSLLVEGIGGGSLLMAQSPGTFSRTGNLTTTRTSHTATLLTNGRVLITGGVSVPPPFSVWASAELYDPSTGTFTATGEMTTSRSSHTATLLPNGKVLIAGGQSRVGAVGSSAVASAEVYDPTTNTFAVIGAMSTPRSGHTATLLPNGKVLITGGYASDVQSSAELYDPLTGIFTPTGRMVAARSGHVAVLLPNGKVLIEGGNNCGDDGQPNPELYDPATGEFTLTGPSAYPPSSALSAVAASLLPMGNVLSILNVGCDVYSRAEVYDSVSGTFTASANVMSRGYTTVTLLPDGKVLIAGREWVNPGGSAELYDPATGTFSTSRDMVTQREEGHTATLLPNGTVLLSGGWLCCGYSINTAEVYHPAMLTPSPLLFSLSGDGKGPGAILHSGTHQVVSPDNPAVPGEALELYLTGLTDGSVIPPQVAIGGRMAEILFFGKAPGFPNLNQVNVRVPNGVTPGPAVPVRLTYISRPSNEVTISVR